MDILHELVELGELGRDPVLDLPVNLWLLFLDHLHPVREGLLVQLEAGLGEGQLLLDVFCFLVRLLLLGSLLLRLLILVHVVLVAWVPVGTDRLDKLGLLARENFAAGLDHLEEVIRQLERVIRASLQLLAIVEEFFEVVERNFAYLERVFIIAFVSEEEVLNAVVLAVGALLDEVVLEAGLLVDNLNRLLLECKQERNGAVWCLDDLGQDLEQRFFAVIFLISGFFLNVCRVLPLEDLVLRQH